MGGRSMARRKQTATVDLRVRMKEPLRAALEAEARKKGHSLNAEAVHRLERSFDRQDLLTEVLTLAFSAEMADLLRQATPEIKAFASDKPRQTLRFWRDRHSKLHVEFYEGLTDEELEMPGA